MPPQNKMVQWIDELCPKTDRINKHFLIDKNKLKNNLKTIVYIKTKDTTQKTKDQKNKSTKRNKQLSWILKWNMKDKLPVNHKALDKK